MLKVEASLAGSVVLPGEILVPESVLDMQDWVCTAMFPKIFLWANTLY